MRVQGFQFSHFLALSFALRKGEILVSLYTGVVALLHQMGTAHGRQVSEAACSVTHHTGLPPQLLFDVFCLEEVQTDAFHMAMEHC